MGAEEADGTCLHDNKELHIRVNTFVNLFCIKLINILKTRKQLSFSQSLPDWYMSSRAWIDRIVVKPCLG